MIYLKQSRRWVLRLTIQRPACIECFDIFLSLQHWSDFYKKNKESYLCQVSNRPNHYFVPRLDQFFVRIKFKIGREVGSTLRTFSTHNCCALNKTFTANIMSTVCNDRLVDQSKTNRTLELLFGDNFNQFCVVLNFDSRTVVQAR